MSTAKWPLIKLLTWLEKRSSESNPQNHFTQKLQLREFGTKNAKRTSSAEATNHRQPQKHQTQVHKPHKPL
jgi:hypothetical protein